MLVPGGFQAHSMMYILERQTPDTFRFVAVNTDPLMGLAYHQASVHNPPKIMYVLFIYKSYNFGEQVYYLYGVPD